MKVYLVWRENHLDKPKEWRGRRVRGCWGKLGHEEKGFAERAAALLPPRPGLRLNVYRCDICKLWHVGNSRFPPIYDVTKVSLTPMQASPILEPAIERNPSMTTLIPCDSSLVSGYFYDDATWVLAIQFRGTGETRLYAEFPPELYDDFEKAKSKGQFFNQHIAKKFPVQKSGVTIENAPAKAVESDPVLEADIAAQEAEWAKDSARVGKRVTVISATEVGDWPTGALFPSSDIPKVEQVPNGFDAGGGFAFERQKVEQEAVEAPEPEILSPEQAVAVISPKSPKADALTTEAHRLSAIAIEATDDSSYTKLFEHTQRITTVRRALFDLIDPYREIAYRAYEAIQNLNKSRLGPPDAAIKSNKGKLLVYEQALEAKKREAQRLADEAAQAAAEVERLRLQDELTHAEMGDALAEGNTDRAEELLQNPIQLPATQVYSPPVQQYSAPLTRGGSTRKNWKAEVKDKEALILDIAAGIKHFKEHGHLGQHAPDTFIDFNATAMNQEAKSKEVKMVYPGVRVWNDSVKSIKGF